MSKCGPAGGDRVCVGAGECCDLGLGRCVSGQDACAGAHGQPGLGSGAAYAYDGPPAQQAYDADAVDTLFADRASSPGCGETEKPIRCGAAVNAECPYRAGGVDLCCFQEDPDAPLSGTCRPCLGSTGPDGRGVLILWEGSWV
jgi:hypothetical protein